MARRITAGAVGEPSVGAVLVAPTAVITTATNQDITINPTGTGNLVIDGDALLQAQSELRFFDTDSSNYVSFQAPTTVSTNVSWILPDVDAATAGDALVSDGAGNLSWDTITIGVTDETSDSGTFYPLITQTTSGQTTGINVSTTKLSFQPSTGTVFAPIMTGGTGSGNTLTLRSTTNGTKGQVYIDESTASTSTTTGALRVGGGVGIAGGLNVGGTLTVGGGTVPSGFSSAYLDSSTTYDAEGWMTGFTANGIVYSLITYEYYNGLGEQYETPIKRPVSWRETDSTTSIVKNIVVTYNDSTGRVATITVT